MSSIISKIRSGLINSTFVKAGNIYICLITNADSLHLEGRYPEVATILDINIFLNLPHQRHDQVTRELQDSAYYAR